MVSNRSIPEMRPGCDHTVLKNNPESSCSEVKGTELLEICLWHGNDMRLALDPADEKQISAFRKTWGNENGGAGGGGRRGGGGRGALTNLVGKCSHRGTDKENQRGSVQRVELAFWYGISVFHAMLDIFVCLFFCPSDIYLPQGEESFYPLAWGEMIKESANEKINILEKLELWPLTMPKSCLHEHVSVWGGW